MLVRVKSTPIMSAKGRTTLTPSLWSASENNNLSHLHERRRQIGKPLKGDTTTALRPSPVCHGVWFFCIACRHSNRGHYEIRHHQGFAMSSSSPSQATPPPAPPASQTHPPAPPPQPIVDMTFTVQRGADALPTLKKQGASKGNRRPGCREAIWHCGAVSEAPVSHHHSRPPQ